jgi:hypothetical protein
VPHVDGVAGKIGACRVRVDELDRQRERTPAATPVAPAMLPRMSLRTIPESINALATDPSARFDPSAGYGPSVSSRMTLQLALVVVPVEGVLVKSMVAVSVVASAAALPLSPAPPQPKSASVPAPAIMPSARRLAAAAVLRTPRS